MTLPPHARSVLLGEAHALRARLSQVAPFSLTETMVPAAQPSAAALTAIEGHLAAGRRRLEAALRGYLAWLAAEGAQATAEEAHARLVLLRIRFNSDLSQLDIFSDAITQRSEHRIGPWLAGLDALAHDALALRGMPPAPPIVCHLDRGRGAAIRRARTRLPGGELSPVALVRVPRERMVGHGVASSLVHETGHQGAALLGLVESLRPEVDRRAAVGGPDAGAWALLSRWLGEIVPDLWAVARVGIAGTRGLFAVVSLPRVFIFHVTPGDPHPTPWVRVLLSAAFGQALYPDPQWARLASTWRGFYPLRGLPAAKLALLASLERAMPAFVQLVLAHRPASLRGGSVAGLLRGADRTPNRLRALYARSQADPRVLSDAPPTLAFATVGQARADGAIPPSSESRLLARLLTGWALRRALASSASAASCPCRNARNSMSAA